MWNGWKPQDLEELSYDDALLLWELYQKGMGGPSRDYHLAYNNYAMLHNLTQTFVAANAKNYTPKDAEKFETVFNTAHCLMTLQNHARASELSVGTQSVLAIPGAPQWLLEAANDEIMEARNGST